MKSLNSNKTLILLLLCLPLIIVTSCGDDGGSIFSPSSPEVSSKVDKVTIRSKTELANTPISVGRELTLDADAYNKDGSNISLGAGWPGGVVQPVSMQWSSSNPSVAIIKQGGKFGNSGLFKAISPGKTKICVEASGVTDCVTITVR